MIPKGKPEGIPDELWEETYKAIKTARSKGFTEKKGKPQKYWCPTCGLDHQEKAQPNKWPVLPDRCSANYRQPNGYWRVCHGDFTIVGGPNALPGPAYLCDPCAHRLGFKKAIDGLKMLEELLAPKVQE